MKYVLVLFLIETTSLLCFLDRVDGSEDVETEWRPEAQRVALEALAQKYPRVVTQDTDAEIYRYSASSVSDFLPLFFYDCAQSRGATLTRIDSSLGEGENSAFIFVPNHAR